MEDFGMKKKLIVLMIAVSMSFSTDILAAQEKNINDMTLEELKEAYLKLQSEYMELKDSQEKGYGIVSGTITYNNGIADTNSMVILLPKDGSAKNKTIELPPGYMINNVDKIIKYPTIITVDFKILFSETLQTHILQINAKAT